MSSVTACFLLPSVRFWGFSIKRSATISGCSERFASRMLWRSQKGLRNHCGSAHSIASVRSTLTMCFAIAGDLKPICAIELNDQSHAQDNRKGRDKFLEDVCAAAKLPLIFIPAQRSYTLPEVCQAIAGVIGRNGVVPAAVSVESEEQSPVSSAAPEVVSNAATDPVCPRCSSPMVRRIAKSGENAGKEFWGCTKFPACRGVVLL